MKAKPYCPDCGPAAVSHATEYWSARFDEIFSILTKPLDAIWRAVKPAVARARFGRIAPALFRAAAAIRLGTIVVPGDDENTWRTRVLAEEAARRGILMREFRPFGLARDIYFASYRGDSIAFDGLPRPRNARESSLLWMDDKGLLLKKLAAAGVPVPRGGSARTADEAAKIFRDIGGAAIVKPAIGSRSRHTFVGLHDEAAVRRAFASANELSPRVVVEEELRGFVFRVTLVGGRIAGIMRREPPHVTGDGTHSVAELVAIENKNPLRSGPIFHHLTLDGDEARAALAAQSLTPGAIPAKGRFVTLHPKVSRSFGASTTEIEHAHPENEKLFLAIGKALDDPLVGIDFMMEDMSRSWREQRCGVIECNSLPFIDLHHYPLKGPARNVAGLVWDLIFPASAGTEIGSVLDRDHPVPQEA